MKTLYKNNDIAIWGASGHANFVKNILKLNGWNVIGVVVDSSYSYNNTYNNKLLGDENILDILFKQGIRNFALGFGDCKQREIKSKYLNKLGFNITTSIHPSASIASNSNIGKGVIIGANVTIDPNVIINNYSIINNNVCICHDSKIGTSVHICPGVSIAGNVNIKNRTWIGIGSIIKERITIGHDSFIGAGSLVIEDIPPMKIAYGSPSTVRN
ncbi:MAG TPA: NeuD/PglB/VioB family sugar acetyltransferase [Victivallales bacterium]|nr:NeuD/PglB/VioB family sugar acetyltransferase [Victivallales bacterium]|tara:strand:- start:731 stop:1372 length:642 start_codon:yes stop_codon:yes gene_type:complete